MVTYDDRDRLGLSPVAPPRLPVGQTVRDTFRVIARSWVKLYGLSLIVLLVSLPLALLIARQVPDLLTRAADPTRVDLHPKIPNAAVLREMGGFYFVQFVVSLYVFGAMVDAAFRKLESGTVGFAASLKAGFFRFFPMLLAALVFYIVMMLGLVLLVVPGVIFGAAYGLAPTLAVVERQGPFASFSRSADLTRGNRWRCIGVTLLLFLLPAFVIGVVDQILGFVIGRQYAFVISSVSNFVLLPLIYVFPAVLAYELRRLKEGGAPSAVADVF